MLGQPSTLAISDWVLAHPKSDPLATKVFIAGLLVAGDSIERTTSGH